MAYLFLVVILITMLCIIFYESIVWVEIVEKEKRIKKEKQRRINEYSGLSHYEKIIKQANEYLYPCLQQMEWGVARHNKNFIPTVKELLLRDGVRLPHTPTGQGNLEILAFSSAKALETVNTKDKDEAIMQEVYAKEVIKGLIRTKGLSFLNQPYFEICNYFKIVPSKSQN